MSKNIVRYKHSSWTKGGKRHREGYEMKEWLKDESPQKKDTEVYKYLFFVMLGFFFAVVLNTLARM